VSTAFEASLEDRNAADYADFLLAYLGGDFRVLDVGCGSGTITLGLGERVAHVIGVDQSDEEFADARSYAVEHEIGNVEFQVGSVYALDFPVDHFDACLCHSMLETLERPLDGLIEIKRTLKPGGVLGVACVEYGGLILAGPNEELLRRFYAIRE
jgi:ubiquinone/menaquinone biosynthesis C-methylase UbiE